MDVSTKIVGKISQIIHFFGGFSIIFAIHFGGFPPIFGNTHITNKFAPLKNQRLVQMDEFPENGAFFGRIFRGKLAVRFREDRFIV